MTRPPNRLESLGLYLVGFVFGRMLCKALDKKLSYDPFVDAMDRRAEFRHRYGADSPDLN